jgi:hypothetical protein
VTHDVAGFHRGHEAVEEMEVGAADRACRHFDDGIAGMFDRGIGDGIAANIVFAMPN